MPHHEWNSYKWKEFYDDLLVENGKKFEFGGSGNIYNCVLDALNTIQARQCAGKAKCTERLFFQWQNAARETCTK